MTKDDERKIVELLLRSLPDAPEGVLKDNKWPDFLLQSSEAIVGIEVTELFEERPAEGGQTAAREFGQVQVVLKKAQDESQARSLPPVQVIVEFAGGSIPDKRSGALAMQLVDLVSVALPPSDGSATLEQSYGPHPTLPPEVERIDIYRPRSLSRHCWSPIDAGFARNNLVEHLQARIDAKRAKYHRYVNYCDTCWLVIYSSGLPGVSLFSPTEPLAAGEFSSPFARIFYLDGFAQRPIELRITV